MVSETEEITYCVSLPWMEGCLYSYDQTHQLILEGEQETERQDIILNYRKDEEVKIGILTSDFFDVAELHLFNSKDETIDRKESAYTWDAEKRELDFFMPEEDLFLELKIEERVMETQSDMAWQEADIIEADPAVDAVTVPETFINEVQENTEVSIQDQEQEQEIFSEHKENTTVSEPDEVQTYGMVLEMDGLPTQGSIIQMETMTIPYDTWEFNPETDFTNITFSTEENSITYNGKSVNAVYTLDNRSYEFS